MQQLTIEHCTQNDVTLLSEILEHYGAVSVTMTDQFDDPILEPEPGTVPLWPHVVLQALYEPEIDVDSIVQIIMHHYPTALCSIEHLPDEDWERACLDQFHPQRFGKRLWICPSWHTPPDPNAVNLILDPGLAFGTGSHATTALCLNWLDQEPPHNKTVIDYGCGSGILGIAALKLGAKHVFAVDIDPQALIATQSNATINHINPQDITVDYPNTLQSPVHIIVANILLTPLLDLKHSFHRLLRPHGILVISGILGNQTHTLMEAYHSHFHLLNIENEGDWALMVFEKISVPFEQYLN
ncbi:MAG TPA: 50S ribosomal protein L11 methyltransferase [Legionellaceae bacterium]|nr:50S ribosomal protein L11 methyltransferase [Legionellaceae bacterium]